LLFDHGLDALNTTVCTLVQCAAFQTGDGWVLFLMWTVAVTPFICATWEEYYTGKLTLQYVNGPTDGVLICIAACVLGAIYPGLYGTPCAQIISSLKGTPLETEPMCLLLILAGVAALVPTVASNVYNVITQNVNHHGGLPLLTLLPFVVLYGVGLGWAALSPARVYHRHPRVFMFMIGFLMCNLLCKLMLAHLCRYKFKYMRTVLIPLLVLVALALTPRYRPDFKLPVHEDVLLYAAAFLSFAFWLHFVVNVIYEITTVLKISCFSIPFPSADSKAKRVN